MTASRRAGTSARDPVRAVVDCVAIVVAAVVLAVLAAGPSETALGERVAAHFAPPPSQRVAMMLADMDDGAALAGLLARIDAGRPAAIGLRFDGGRLDDALRKSLGAARAQIVVAGVAGAPPTVRTAPAGSAADGPAADGSVADGSAADGGVARDLPVGSGLPPFALAVSEAAGGPSVLTPGRIVFARAEPEVLRPGFRALDVRGKVVLVGAANRVRVPPTVPGARGGTLPAIALDAHVVTQLLDGTVRWPTPRWAILASAVVAAAGGALLRPLRVVAACLVGVGVIGVAVAAAVAVFATTPAAPPILTPLLAFALASGGMVTRRVSLLCRDRAARVATLSRMVAPAVADRIADSAGLDHPPERRVVSVLAVAVGVDDGGGGGDAANREPARAAAASGALLDAVVERILAAEGTLTAVAAGHVAAVFGAPEWGPDHAARAVACARSIVAADARAEGRDGVFRAGGRIAAGIATGDAVVARCGSGPAAPYAALGETAATAEALCDTARRGGLGILVTERTRQRADGAFRPAGRHVVAGRCHQAIRTADAAYDAAFAALDTGSPRAAGLVEALAQRRPDDPLVARLARRAARQATSASRSVSAASSDTETSCDTPFSTMVTP